VLEPEWLAELKVLTEKQQCVPQTTFYRQKNKTVEIFGFFLLDFLFFSSFSSSLLVKRNLFVHPRQILISVSVT
jgi:hypothetical protein